MVWSVVGVRSGGAGCGKFKYGIVALMVEVMLERKFALKYFRVLLNKRFAYSVFYGKGGGLRPALCSGFGGKAPLDLNSYLGVPFTF